MDKYLLLFQNPPWPASVLFWTMICLIFLLKILRLIRAIAREMPSQAKPAPADPSRHSAAPALSGAIASISAAPAVTVYAPAATTWSRRIALAALIGKSILGGVALCLVLFCWIPSPSPITLGDAATVALVAAVAVAEMWGSMERNLLSVI